MRKFFVLLAIFVFLFVLVFWFIGGENFISRDPEVQGVSPSSGVQGKDLDVMITGKRFKDGLEIYLIYNNNSPTEIKAANVEVLSSKKIKCTLPITFDEPVGKWGVGVLNSDGGKAYLESGFFTKSPDAP